MSPSTRLSLSTRIRVLLACTVTLVICPRQAAADDSKTPLTFEQHIRPILRAHCFDCHGAVDEIQGGLDLRQVRRMLRGGESGPALMAGNPEHSRLLQRIRAGEMPPGNSKVTPAELDTLTAWIQQGAKTLREEPEMIPPGLGLTPEERSFWSFQPIRRPDIPVVAAEQAPFVRSPIDAFLLSAMPPGLTFAEEADRHTLIRRLFVDLTGLPPTRADHQRWQADPGPDWYDRLIDELLASPHYGERWARHWLDIAGYADSDGYTVADADRPWSWKYRDYVVRSFNADKPLDQFIIEQLAGDELAGPLEGDLSAQQIERLTATGFLRMAADGTGSGADNETGRNQVIADTLKIVSTSLLGLSLACAQCHDHRYDPIPQADYYALRAVLTPAFDWQNWKTPQQRLVSLYSAADRQKAAEVEAAASVIAAEKAAKQGEYMQQALEKELSRYDGPLRDQLRLAYTTAADQRTSEQKALLAKYPSVNISPGVLYQYLPKAAEDLKTYDARISEVRRGKPPEEFLSVLTEPAGHLPETRLFYRGDFQQPKNVITPGTLTVACPEDQRVEFPVDDATLPTSGRRLAFARWLTSRSNPLTARVLVNRLWLHHFGQGIVGTPADFGTLGARPSHPELLDWLADELCQQGFSMKQMHRLLLSSAAWRQSTRRSPKHDELDPDNRYFSRRRLIRLDAEVLRDQMLAVSGRLDLALAGPPVPVREDDTGQVIVEPGQGRRSLYVKVRRSQPVALLQAFDAPVMETNCEVRPASTVATQSLMLMNAESVLELAAALADRCTQDSAEVSEQVRRAWQLAYGRDASAEELQQAVEFVVSQTKIAEASSASLPSGRTAAQQALITLCHALLTSNEFLYVD